MIKRITPETKRFIIDKFRKYYRSSPEAISPSCIKKREFGFILFENNIMIRHERFENKDNLRAHLASLSPAHVYYSSAYYENPKADMVRKGWEGADLIFDIDADHLNTPCNKIHDQWNCIKCGFKGKGITPVKCPNCAYEKFNDMSWMCEKCLESAKNETITLIRILCEELGFTENGVKVYFSGNRGYHVHIESEEIHELDSIARKEITDYIIGLGFKPELHKIIDRERVVIDLKYLSGLNHRISEGFFKFLSESIINEIEKIGLNKRSLKFLSENKEIILENLKEKGWFPLKGVGGWKKIIKFMVNNVSSKIDTVVTTDTHRLIRLAGTLHGKTGFMKVETPINKLEDFDPLKKSIVNHDGNVMVSISETPEFRIGDTYYGPFKNTKVELPTQAALLLLCKGVAQVVD